MLKVAHHGSAYQEPGFLDAVDPAVALVSVGQDNDYGHPNAGAARPAGPGRGAGAAYRPGGDVAAVLTGHGLAVAARGSPPAGDRAADSTASGHRAAVGAQSRDGGLDLRDTRRVTLS